MRKIINFIKLLAPTPPILKYPDIFDVWNERVIDRINNNN